MKNLKKLLFAAALIGAAVVSAPKTASADNPWCNRCAASGGSSCFDCCVCDGHPNPITYCSKLCS